LKDNKMNVVESPALEPDDRYGTFDNFRYNILIADRTQHQTEEAQAAVASRYNTSKSHTAATTILQAHGNIEHPILESDTTCTTLEYNILAALTRCVSAAVTKDNAKAAPAALSLRLAQWKDTGLGVALRHPSSTQLDDNEYSVFDPSTILSLSRTEMLTISTKKLKDLARTHGRACLALLTELCLSQLDLQHGGINRFYLLKRDSSWVAVAQYGRVYFGIGEYP
jgi:hypothetical protein